MKTKQWDINLHTPLVPYIIAERAIWNILEQDQPDLLPNECLVIVENNTGELVSKAERLYTNNEGFRKQINDKRKDCRYVLEMYMEHWFKALLKIEIKKRFKTHLN